MTTTEPAPPAWEPWAGAAEDAWRDWEAGDPGALVPGLANTAPSGVFALELDVATAHPGALTAAELVDAAVGFERVAAWAAARQAAVLAEFARRPADGSIAVDRVAGERAFVGDEVALALTVAPSTGAEKVEHATRMDGVLRPTRDALQAGRLCAARARLVCRALDEHDDEVAAAVQARVLPTAHRSTCSQLRAALTRALLALVPDQGERHRRARRERAVQLFPGRDGMATVVATLTAPDASGCFDWLTRLARGVQVPDGACAEHGPGRGSMDRRRADVFVALCTGRLATRTGEDVTAPLVATPVAAHRPLVQVVVPITTLMGFGEEPAELAGYGPVPADVAREIAADPRSTWQRLLTDPGSGQLLDVGRTTYRPPESLARFVRARDGECRHPTCRRRASACELDHVHEWQHGGTTSEHNLCALCGRHHDAKEQAGWSVVLRDDRTVEWTTPTGHRYTSRPVDHHVPATSPGPSAEAAPVRSRAPAVTDLLVRTGAEDGTAPF